MDYSKVPLAKRTRWQEVLFFREYHEKKKRAKSGGGGGGGESGGGTTERESGGGARVEGGGANVGDSGSVAGSGVGSPLGGRVEVYGVDVGLKEGVGSVSFERGDTSGTKRVGKLEKGLKKNRNVVSIEGNSKKHRKNKKGVKKGKNVVIASVDSMKKHKSVERLKKNKNVARMNDDDESENEVENFVKARVDAKKNKESSKRSKKNKNVVRAGVVDDESEDEIGKNRKGVKKDKNVVTSADLMKRHKSVERLKKNKNVVRMSDDDDEVEDFVKARVDSKKNKKSSKRLKKDKNVVQMGVDDDEDDDDSEDKFRKSKKRVKKDQNVATGIVDLMKTHKSVEKLKKNKNVIRMCDDGDDESEDEVENFVKARVDLKKNKKSSKRLKKNKNVAQMGVDDDESEDGVQFLGMKDKNGTVIEVDEVAEYGVVDSNCSSLEKESEEFCNCKNCHLKDREEVVSSHRKGKKSAIVKINDGKSCGVSSQARSRLGASNKEKKVIEVVSNDSEDSYESSKSQDVRGSNSTDSAESIDSSDSGNLESSESSSEEGSDRSSDEDYRVDNSSTSVSSDDSSSSSEDEDESAIVNRASLNEKGKQKMVGVGSVNGKGKDKMFEVGNVIGKGKDKMVEDGLKRGRGRPRKVVCLGQLSSCSLDGEGKDGSGSVGCEKNDCQKETEGPKTVAERLRLRQRVCKSKKSKKKKQEIGSFSSPFTLTDEELDYSSVDEDVTDGDWNTCFKNGNDGKYVQIVGEKDGEGNGKEEVVRPAKRSRNGVDSAASISVDKILADSIWEKGDMPLENLVSSRDKVPDQETTLPLKFRFEDEDLKPPDKSYWDIEADKLFAERDFALAACEIGSSDCFMVFNEDSITIETETDPATCCRQGKHQLVLDEQIGLRCKFCSFVTLEIKHILPSFGKHPLGRPGKKDFGSTDQFNIDELQFQDSASEYQSGSKRYIHTEGTVWDIIPGVKRSMYPHQREGFEFIWKNLAGGIYLEELKKQAFDGGNGCIISHAPGTGKTRLAIVFLQTYMELYPTCRPVIIAPCSMLLTWEEEFRKWKVDIPFHNLNKLEFSGQENAKAVNLLRKFGRRKKKNSIRMVKLYSWIMDRSILGISYRLFEKLAGDGVFADVGSKKEKFKHFAVGEEVRKMLLELPSLLVLDEGHTPRNDQSLIWKAVSRVETQRRIILSGTPFQNNFKELFNTLCLVRPEFTDRIISETQGSRRKQGTKSNAARGKWASLTSSIGKYADHKLDELRAMIDSFVHVHRGSILKESLPGLRDSLVVLQPTRLQKALIEVVHGKKNNAFVLDYLVSLISVHPSLLLGFCLSEKQDLSVDTHKLEMLKVDPGAGVKTKFLMELIRLSGALKEKVLVFSQYIDSLTFIREQVTSHFDWTEGKEVLYMDGALDVKHRQSSISFLNDPASEVRVLLASTKACSEGINLVGASRVVLLDVVWNPSVERQAISRAYRLGQKKVVYIYHLIMSGTMEGEKYIRQAEKDRLSELVFSSVDGGVHKPEISCTVTEDIILQEMVQHEKLSNMFEKILNQPKESDLIDTFGLVDL